MGKIFRVGDYVRLSTSNNRMEVKEIEGSEILCTYLSNKEDKEEWFDKDELELVEEVDGDSKLN